MKVYILVDETNIVRCLATEEGNLHKDKLHMKKYHTEMLGIVGDEYIAQTGAWIKHPENYPKPSEKATNEAKIAARIRKIAVDQLKNEGELPPDYKLVGE